MIIFSAHRYSYVQLVFFVVLSKEIVPDETWNQGNLTTPLTLYNYIICRKHFEVLLFILLLFFQEEPKDVKGKKVDAEKSNTDKSKQKEKATNDVRSPYFKGKQKNQPSKLKKNKDNTSPPAEKERSRGSLRKSTKNVVYNEEKLGAKDSDFEEEKLSKSSRKKKLPPNIRVKPDKDKDFVPPKKGPPKSLSKISTSWGEYYHFDYKQIYSISIVSSTLVIFWYFILMLL